MNIQPLIQFALERDAIFHRRENGAQPPWTDDPILRKYRFCNIQRQNDTVTRWIAEHWIAKHDEDPELWFACVIARFFNLPESLAELGYPVPFDTEHLMSVMSRRKSVGKKNFNGAYMVTTNAKKGDKVWLLNEHVFKPLWAKRELLAWKKDSMLLRQWFEKLIQNNGIGTFLGAQVVADVKHSSQWITAPDWWTFAASGPGSRRGLNRVLGRDYRAAWTEESWREAFEELRVEFVAQAARVGLPHLCAQDIQSCLCEFDKYERVRLGQGDPKQLYKHKEHFLCT